jgi:DNA-binding NarL/FixJ family response regulator
MTIKKKTIIEEYRELTEDIAVIKSCIISTERDINKEIKAFKPNDLGAIDYSKPTVQTSFCQESLTTVCIKLHDLNTELEDLKNELNSLYKQRDEIEKVINDLGDIEKKVIMLRIKGYSNQRIADVLHYSKGGVNHIFERIYKKQKEGDEMGIANVI